MSPTGLQVGDTLKIAALFEIDLSKSLKEGEVEVIVATPNLDRDGQTIDINGIDISKIAHNGPVMWSHDYSSAPIGKIEKLWKTAGVLKARVSLAIGINPMADMVYRMVKEGYIKAVSIGGMVKEFGRNKDGTADFSHVAKMEMIELSFCAIGANPEALVTLKSLEKQIENKDHDMDLIMSSIESLKHQVSALESAMESSRVPEQKTAKQITRKKLVLAKSAAKQVDKQSEMIIASINNCLGEKYGRRNNGSGNN